MTTLFPTESHKFWSRFCLLSWHLQPPPASFYSALFFLSRSLRAPHMAPTGGFVTHVFFFSSFCLFLLFWMATSCFSFQNTSCKCHVLFENCTQNEHVAFSLIICSHLLEQYMSPSLIEGINCCLQGEVWHVGATQCVSWIYSVRTLITCTGTVEHWGTKMKNRQHRLHPHLQSRCSAGCKYLLPLISGRGFNRGLLLPFLVMKGQLQALRCPKPFICDLFSLMLSCGCQQCLGLLSNLRHCWWASSHATCKYCGGLNKKGSHRLISLNA